MKITDFMLLLGGLGLFLYGMKMMSERLETAAGNKLKGILEKLTSNRFLGVFVGMVITALIQSSSATTVMVVGFVNSGLMTLNQAVWVIMGANIGTTITGQLIALDIGALAPLIAFIGVMIILFFKSKRTRCIGEIIAGLGILFIGMDFMGNAMVPLRDSTFFIKMMTSFSNPLFGIAAGALFTALIQSSSASIGILQTLASSGLIGLNSSIYILFGQNIGTCITAIIASIGTNHNAKRTTIIHLLFNIIGTLLFVTIALTLPFTDWVAHFTPNSPAAQIANVHTLFNITTTLLLLPFGNLLAAIARKLLPGEDLSEPEMQLEFVKPYQIGSTAITLSQLCKEVHRMFKLATQNVTLAFDAVAKNSIDELNLVYKNEHYLDYLNMEIIRYISKISATDMPLADAKMLNALFKITGDIERIGDHALNIAQYEERIHNENLTLSEPTLKELQQMRLLILDTFHQIASNHPTHRVETLDYVLYSEETIDKMNQSFRQNQIERFHLSSCSPEACVLYSEMLIDIERISDHLLNIAQTCYQAELYLTDTL